MNREIKQPKYKIGDVLVVYSENDKQKIVQGKIVSAECFYDQGMQGTWFYAIEVPSESGVTEPQRVYSYEEDTGNAKTKILSPKEQN